MVLPRMRDADAIVVVWYRGEIEDDDATTGFILAQIGENRLGRIVAVDPLEALGLKIETVQHRFCHICLIEISDEPLYPLVVGVLEKMPVKTS
jgi:hypothetical protein